MGLEMSSSDWNHMFLSVTYKSIGFNVPSGDKMFWSNPGRFWAFYMNLPKISYAGTGTGTSELPKVST